MFIRTISDFVPADAVVMPLHGADVEAVLRELADACGRSHAIDPAFVLDALIRRERLSPTALGQGVALPHARAKVPHTIGVIGICPRGVEAQAPDGQPVHLFVAIVSPETGNEHLQALAVSSRTLAEPELRDALLRAGSRDEVWRALGR